MAIEITRDGAEARFPPLPIALIAAAPLLLLPGAAQAVAAVLLVAVLGISHGASDHALARPAWERRFGPRWLPLFVVTYLALAGAMLIAWMVAPAAALLGFLVLAAIHFALDDLPDDFRADLLPEMMGRGLLPVTGAALLHRGELTQIFTVLLGQAEVAEAFAGAMANVSLAAAAACIVAIAWRLYRGEAFIGIELAAILIALLVFPPVLGFALYFCFVHARRQLQRRYRRLAMQPGEYRRAFAPFVLGGVAVLGVALAVIPAIDSLLIVGLAALTVPHMLLFVDLSPIRKLRLR